MASTDNGTSITTQQDTFDTTSATYSIRFRYPDKNPKAAVSDLTKVLAKMGVMDGLKEKK